MGRGFYVGFSGFASKKKTKTPFKRRNAQNASRKSLTVKLHSKNKSHCCTGIEVGLIRHLVASRGAWLRENIENTNMCSMFEGCIIGSTYMQLHAKLI